MTYVKFDIPYSKMDADKVERLKAAFSALKQIRDEIEADWRASPEGLGAQAMHQVGYGSSKISLSWGDANGLKATVKVSEDFEQKRSLSPSLNIGEKTINALLTGKLLTDEEKKALLKRMGVDLDTLAEKAGA
ncbi:hypothetical protein CN162_12815 [Sinorhizobium meliloti]|uniref:hypothetical protein n=1 Tax=Rhizobium meliloti TaxID=382 RepID=UPI000FD918AF|nr:hypothetical protein [Sinorhizobium meliloti]RVK56941.1 hypothetical protein CN162_12815 [Sinorhizobium meliloti]